MWRLLLGLSGGNGHSHDGPEHIGGKTGYDHKHDAGRYSPQKELSSGELLGIIGNGIGGGPTKRRKGIPAANRQVYATASPATPRYGIDIFFPLRLIFSDMVAIVLLINNLLNQPKQPYRRQGDKAVDGLCFIKPLGAIQW
jgi:hypothetical protein